MGRRGMAKGPTPPHAPFDPRIDPSDDKAYTYDEFFARYQTYYQIEEITYYWNPRMARARPHSVGEFRVKVNQSTATQIMSVHRGCASH